MGRRLAALLGRCNRAWMLGGAGGCLLGLAVLALALAVRSRVLLA
jgi:hypothetical protein